MARQPPLSRSNSGQLLRCVPPGGFFLPAQIGENRNSNRLPQAYKPASASPWGVVSVLDLAGNNGTLEIEVEATASVVANVLLGEEHRYLCGHRYGIIDYAKSRAG